MALFSNKIIDVRYMNAEYSIVEILYTDDDGLVYSYGLEVDEDSADWKDLEAEGWSGEKLIQGTAEYKRQSSAAFNSEVNAVARKLAEEMVGMSEILTAKEQLLLEKEQLTKKVETLDNTVQVLDNKVLNLDNTVLNLDQNIKTKTNQQDSTIFSYLLKANVDKDELFKFKLWALELDVVKSSSKEVKSSIRKCTNIIKGLNIVNDLSSSVEP